MDPKYHHARKYEYVNIDAKSEKFPIQGKLFT